jgi:hypothetical protein
VTFKVYDQLGKLIKELNALWVNQNTNRTMDISLLPGGIYYLNIIQTEERYVQKIIKY